MTPRKTLALCGACAAVAVPSTALAAAAGGARPVGQAHHRRREDPLDAQAGAERRTLRLARKEARLRHAKLTAAYKDKLGAMTVARARG